MMWQNERRRTEGEAEMECEQVEQELNKIRGHNKFVEQKCTTAGTLAAALSLA